MSTDEQTKTRRKLPQGFMPGRNKHRPRGGLDTGRPPGLRVLEDLDGRTRAYKVAQRLVLDMEVDLGGADRLTSGIRELIKRAALLGAIAEDFEARWLENEKVNLADYLSAVNSQRRVLTTIGLERVSRNVTPDATGPIVDAIRSGAV